MVAIRVLKSGNRKRSILPWFLRSKPNACIEEIAIEGMSKRVNRERLEINLYHFLEQGMRLPNVLFAVFASIFPGEFWSIIEVFKTLAHPWPMNEEEVCQL